MTTPRPKKVKPETPAIELYKLSLVLGNQTFIGEGTTVVEALKSLPEPIKIVGKGFLTLTHGEKNMKRMLMPVEAKRMFFPNAQFYQARSLELLLK